MGMAIILPHEGVCLQAFNLNFIPISRTLGALCPHLIRSLAGGQATGANIGAEYNLDSLGLGGHGLIIYGVEHGHKGGGDDLFIFFIVALFFCL